jgi:hypothetical protein
VNSQSAVTRRPRTVRPKGISKSTKKNPQGWYLPYAGRTHVTPRRVPLTVAKVAGSRINKLLKKRANLTKLILLATPRSTRATGPNYSNLHNQRNKVNKNIQRLRALMSHSGYISGPMFANILRNMNART